MRRTAYIGIAALALVMGLALSQDLHAQANRGAGDLVTAIKKAVPAGQPQQLIALLGELGPRNDRESARFLLGLGQQLEQLPEAYNADARMDVFDAIKASLAAGQDPAAQREVLNAAERGANPNQRVLALEVVASTRWEGAEPALIAAVGESRSDPVRLVGIQALAARRSTPGVQPLIDALEGLERNQGTVYWAIHDALREITGQSFDDAAGWKNFWRVRGKTFDPERDRRPPQTGAGAGAERGTTARPRGPSLFGGSEVSSRRVVFVVDVSGSMHHKDPVVGGEAGSSTGSGPGATVPCHDYPGCGFPTQEGLPDTRKRIERVKREFTQLIQALPQATRFNLVTFSTDVQAWKDKALVPANVQNKGDATRYVEAFKAEGSTNILDAMKEAFTNEQADTIYLLSDGNPTPKGYTGGPISDELYRQLCDEILATVREANRFRHVKIHTLGFQGADATLMRQLSEIGNHGEYRDIR